MSFFPKDAEYVAMADAYGPECAACEGDDDAAHVDGCRWIATQDATPAPLDPSKVKAGDTVTVTDGKHTIAGVVDSVRERAAQFWFRFRFGEQPDAYYEVPMALARSEAAFTLTAHQPAPEPEPEPEWKPGTVAVVIPSMVGGKVVRSIRGHEGNWLNEFGGSWDDDEVIDVHELVVIDPADVDRAAIRNALMAEPGAAQGTAHALQVMRIIFTELGIEAAS